MKVCVKVLYFKMSQVCVVHKKTMKNLISVSMLKSVKFTGKEVIHSSLIKTKTKCVCVFFSIFAQQVSYTVTWLLFISYFYLLIYWLVLNDFCVQMNGF